LISRGVAVNLGSAPGRPGLASSAADVETPSLVPGVMPVVEAFSFGVSALG
jgi:hypothetical protein